MYEIKATTNVSLKFPKLMESQKFQVTDGKVEIISFINSLNEFGEIQIHGVRR